MSERRAPHVSDNRGVEVSTAGPTARSQPPDQPPIVGDAPDNDAPPISPLVPASMHRAEADALAVATSPDFSERPDRATAHPPRRPEDETR